MNHLILQSQDLGFQMLPHLGKILPYQDFLLTEPILFLSFRQLIDSDRGDFGRSGLLGLLLFVDLCDPVANRFECVASQKSNI